MAASIQHVAIPFRIGERCTKSQTGVVEVIEVFQGDGAQDGTVVILCISEDQTDTFAKAIAKLGNTSETIREAELMTEILILSICAHGSH